MTTNGRFSCLHYVPEIRRELGGVVQAVVDMCQAIAARGHRVTLFTCDATDAPAQWLEGPGDLPEVIELTPSKFTQKLISRSSLQKFREIAKQVDIAHLHIPWRPANLQLSRVLREERTPFILTSHGVLDDWSMGKKALKKRMYLTLAGRRLFRDATVVHFTARAERDQALQWVPVGDRAVVQCLALDLTAYDSLPGPGPALKAFPEIRQDKKKILFLSRLHPKKGVDLLLGAAALLQKQRSDLQLLIAGPGEESYVAYLKNLASELGVSDMTNFVGMVRGVEKRSIYQTSDVYVLPTHQENFGLVLAEALVCGTPVVTTRGTDIWQELQEGGAKIAELTPESIAAEIAEILEEEDGGVQLGARGKEYVRRWLERDHVLQGYEKIYRETIEKGPPK